MFQTFKHFILFGNKHPFKIKNADRGGTQTE